MMLSRILPIIIVMIFLMLFTKEMSRPIRFIEHNIEFEVSPSNNILSVRSEGTWKQMGNGSEKSSPYNMWIEYANDIIITKVIIGKSELDIANAAISKKNNINTMYISNVKISNEDKEMHIKYKINNYAKVVSVILYENIKEYSESKIKVLFSN